MKKAELLDGIERWSTGSLAYASGYRFDHSHYGRRAGATGAVAGVGPSEIQATVVIAGEPG